MTTKQLYLINKLTSKLDVKSGYLIIAPGGFATIQEADRTEPTIVYALGRDWVEITDVKPEAGAEAIAPVEIVDTKPYEGMTEEELKAELDKGGSKEGVTSTDLGAEEVPAKTTKKSK